MAAGAPIHLPSLPIEYVDFAQWQHQALQGEPLDQQLRYWHKQLADAPTSLDLPLDFPRPVQPTFTGETDIHGLTNIPEPSPEAI